MKKLIAKGGTTIGDPSAFKIIEADKPKASGRDVLVKVEAVSVNPVDTKVRMGWAGKDFTPGWDAYGEVVEAGTEVSDLKVGDKVYYAGDLTRDGSNSEYQLVDYRIVAKAPTTISKEEIAAMPLTSITAWEGIFDRLQMKSGQKLLIIGGSGGVGSVAIQIAKNAGIEVYATASRPETQMWCTKLGAQKTVDHNDIVKEFGENYFDAVFCTTNMEDHWERIAQVLKPQKSALFIDDPENRVDVTVFKPKALKICWEFMFTRSMFQTEDMIEQKKLLTEVASLIDAKKIISTKNKVYQGFTVENFIAAHKEIETQKSIGKIVIVF